MGRHSDKPNNHRNSSNTCGEWSFCGAGFPACQYSIAAKKSNYHLSIKLTEEKK